MDINGIQRLADCTGNQSQRRGYDSGKYQSLAASTNFVPSKSLSFYGTTLGAWDQRNDHSGNQFQLGMNYRLPWDFSVNLSGTHNTAGFRTLLDTLQDEDDVTGIKIAIAHH